MDDTLPGTVLDGRYKIVKLLGTGGMGRVYEAHHEVLQRRVAVKFLLSVSPQALKRFERECQALKTINHESIPEVYACGTSPDGLSYMVMEFCEGRTLQQILDQETRLSSEFVRNMAVAVGECLRATHAAGIVHRDIKPSNIMVADEEGFKVKLLDFGIAHATAGDVCLTGTNEILGSLAYLSPEHLTSKELDARSDLFSLGCVMYRALSGADAIDASKGIAGVLQIGDRKRLPNSVPSYLRNAIDKCLTIKIENRFCSADELVDALRTETDCLVVAEAGSDHFGRRVTLAIVLLLLVGLVSFVFNHPRAPLPAALDPALKAKVDSLPAEVSKIVPFADEKFKEQAGVVVRAKIDQMEIDGTFGAVDEALHLRKGLALWLKDTGDFAGAEAEALELVRRCETGRGGSAATTQLLPLARSIVAGIRIGSHRFDRETREMIKLNNSVADSGHFVPAHSGRFHKQAGDLYAYDQKYELAIGQYRKAVEKFKTGGFAQQELDCLERAKKCAEAIPDLAAARHCADGVNKCKLILYMQPATDRSSVNPPKTSEMELVYYANTSYCKAGPPTSTTYTLLSGLAGRIAGRYLESHNPKLSEKWFLTEFNVAKDHLPAKDALPLLQDAANGLAMNGYKPLAPYALYAFQAVVKAKNGSVLSSKFLENRFKWVCIEAAREKSADSVVLIHLIGKEVRRSIENPQTAAAELVALANFWAPVEQAKEDALTLPSLKLVKARVKGQPITNEIEYAEFLHNLGSTCISLKRFDEALLAMKEAYQICQKNKVTAHIQFVACYHLADSYIKVKDYKLGLLYFDKASDACRAAIREAKTSQEVSNAVSLMTESEYARALIFANRGDIATADKILQEQEKVWAQYRYGNDLVVSGFRALIAKPGKK